MFAEVSPWPFLVCDRRGTIHFANEPLCKLLERSSDELTSARLNQYFTPREGEMALQGVVGDASFDHAWMGQWTTQVGEHPLCLEVFVRADPRQEDLVWVIAMEYPVVNGDIVISQRGELEMMQILMDHTVDHVALTDMTGAIVMLNRSFQQSLKVPYAGYESGKLLSDFVQPETADFWFPVADAQAQPQELVTQTGRFELRSGETRWVRGTRMLVNNSEGERVGWVYVFHDITQLKETEQNLRMASRRADAANRAKSEFLANMSHEIRTPINGIIGMAELALETPLDDEQRGYLETVVSSGGTLLALINDILDFSKIEAGRMELETVDFDPGEVCEDVLAPFIQLAMNKGIEINWELDPSLPVRVGGDPTRLKQVLNNLLSNALKFTEEGQVFLKVTLERTQERHHIRFDVSDTGIGIPEEQRHRVFRDFSQADSSTTRRFGGTGLGLAICKRIIGMMEGQITFQSQAGKGTTFTVQVPFHRASRGREKELRPVQTAEAKPLYEGRSLQVLLAEDHPVNQQIAAARLRKMGHKVTVAEDGVKALGAFQSGAFDLVLMDVQMPGMDGFETTKAIRELEDNEARQRTPIIAMTARVMREDRERCLSVGMDDFLGKPFRAVAFVDLLERFAEKKAEPAAHAPEPEASAQEEPKKSLSDRAAQLAESFDLEPEVLVQAAQVFLECYPADYEAMVKAWRERDLPSLAKTVHRLRSATGNFAADRLGGLTWQVEEAADQGEELLIAALWSELCQELQGLESDLREIVAWQG